MESSSFFGDVKEITVIVMVRYGNINILLNLALDNKASATITEVSRETFSQENISYQF